jgi:hypothetical protein
LDTIRSFPKSEIRLFTEKGPAHHIKTDVFKNQMWYVYEGDAAMGSGLIALTPDRVREIIKINKEGGKPRELNEYVAEIKVKEPDYDNVVGQDSLNRFDGAFRTKKKKKKPGNRPNPNNPNNGPRPQGEGTAVAAQEKKTEGPRPSNNNKRRNRPNRKPGGESPNNPDQNA